MFDFIFFMFISILFTLALVMMDHMETHQVKPLRIQLYLHHHHLSKTHTHTHGWQSGLNPHSHVLNFWGTLRYLQVCGAARVPLEMFDLFTTEVSLFTDAQDFLFMVLRFRRSEWNFILTASVWGSCRSPCHLSGRDRRTIFSRRAVSGPC